VEDLRYFYEHFDYATPPSTVFDLTPNGTSKYDGGCVWVDKYRLPFENDGIFQITH
jgi:hypothetical protein